MREQLTGGGTKCSSEGDANFILSQHFDNCKIQTEIQTLPNTKRTQGIEYFDSFNTFSSKQKLQKALKSQSNLGLILLGKGQEI